MIGSKLKSGDTIGLISPASPEKKEVILEGINFLKGLGFNVKVGSHAFDNIGYLAGKDSDRAKDLMDMFCDKNVNAIMCIRGGYGCMRILPLIDWSLIKQNPKIFIGFSDVTCLLNELYKRCNLITFHGPMLTTNFNDEYTLKSLLTTLQTDKEYTIDTFGIPLISSVNQRKCITEGYIVGGNLSLICSTLGTPYEVDTQNKILLLEAVNEPPYKVDRLLTQLLLANKLQKCRGFIIGQFTNCESDDYDLESVLKDRIYSLNKPTITNLCVGHGYPRFTIPIGAKARLDCVNNKIEILQEVVQ